MFQYRIAYLFSLALIGSLLVSGCGPGSYYSANRIHAPNLEEKNEFQANVGLSKSAETTTMDFSAAYSPVENLGLIIHGSRYFQNVRRESNFQEIRNGIAGSMLGAAAGYYKPINDEYMSSIYFGFAQFNGETLREESPSIYDYTFNRLYVQPSIGGNYDIADLIFSVRGSYLNFTDVEDVGQSVAPPGVIGGGSPFSQPVLSGDKFFLVEPAITLRLGLKNIKLSGQMGLAINVGNRAFDHEGVFINMGITYIFRPSQTSGKSQSYRRF